MKTKTSEEKNETGIRDVDSWPYMVHSEAHRGSKGQNTPAGKQDRRNSPEMTVPTCHQPDTGKGDKKHGNAQCSQQYH